MENCNGKISYRNHEIEIKVVPGPPPPPPPPPPSFLVNQKCKELEYCKKCKIDISSFPANEEQNSIVKYTYCFNDSKAISYYKPIHSIIQDGPSCGIVALSMASQCFQNVDTDVLLAAAKQLKFSKSGEIFSTYNMSSLASSLLNCDATVINNLESSKDLILSHLCNGWPLLMPYDADKNHEPCLNNGRSAHWAILSGLCFTLQDHYNLQHKIEFDIIPSGLKIHFAKNGLFVKELLKYALDVFVYAHQGKSRHLAMWNLDTLLRSNKNLYEITNKYGIDMLVLPESDSLSELRDKCVLLKSI